MNPTHGESRVGADLTVHSGSGWSTQAAVAILQALVRIITSGNVPAEVHVDPQKLEDLRQMTLSDLVDSLISPEDPNARAVRLAAEWWDQHREQLRFVPREGVLYPYVMSQSEQAEAIVFSLAFQHLQERGFDQALQSFGIDLQTVMRSPRMFQEMVWFQFHLLLHSRLKPGIIAATSGTPVVTH